MTLLYQIYRVLWNLRRWLRSKLTPAGWVVVSGLSVLPFMRLQSEFSMGYQLFLLLATALGFGFLYTIRFRGRFSITRTLPKVASVDQPLRYQITLKNTGSRTEHGLFLREQLSRPPLTLEAFRARLHANRNRKSFQVAPTPRRQMPPDHDTVPTPAVAPGGVAVIDLVLTPRHRGRLSLHGVQLSSTDPLGLVRSRQLLGASGELLVLPRRYRLPAIDLPGSARYQAGGVAQSSSIGESEEFVALRDYRRGDSPRHIHWRSWARTGKLIVREYQDEFFVRHALVLDTFITGHEGERFEAAVSIAASFACTIDTQESLLDLMFVGAQTVCFTIGRSLGYPLQALELLSAVEPTQDQSFGVLKAAVGQQLRRLSGCILILVEWDEPRRAWLEELSAMGLPLQVFLVTENQDSQPAGWDALRHAAVQLYPVRADRLETSLAAVTTSRTTAAVDG